METLLNDNLILERSKIWSTAMAKFCQEETYKEIEFNEIQSESGEISDDDAPDETIINNNNENTCNALVKADNFEGDTSTDDFDECANQTFALMKEHQNKWEKFGMMDILETFDLGQISKVVTPWVEKNKLDKSQHSTSLDEHIVHIEEHHHRQVHLASDDDSLHSLDTANYIRSSRRKKRSSCTTTTIKKFSYVKGSRRHLQNKYGLGSFDLNKDLDKVLYEKIPEVERISNRGLKDFIGEKKKSSNFTPPTRPKAIEYEPRSLPSRRRRSRQLKRRSDISKRSVSSSSSSAGSPVRPFKPKFKRSSKGNSEIVNKSEAGTRTGEKKTISPANCQLKIPKYRVPVVQFPEPDFSEAEFDLTNLETSESEMCMKKSLISLPKPQPKLPNAIQVASSSNETGFLGASIINSTALSNTNQPLVPYSMKKCLITPIKNKSELEHQLMLANKLPRVKLARVKTKKEEVVVAKEVEKPKVPTDNSKIQLYCPTNRELHQKHLSGKRFYLTREYFLETVGKKNSRRFIKLNSSKFPFEFDCSSSIYFKVPEESDGSASSDEDILYIFGREGKLIVETVDPKNND